MFPFLQDLHAQTPEDVVVADNSSVMVEQDDIDMDDIEVLNEEVGINVKMGKHVSQEGGEEKHPFLMLNNVK